MTDAPRAGPPEKRERRPGQEAATLGKADKVNNADNALLQISATHVYLTAPFVLSWSVVEAMAAGCLVIGSRTAPVEELIEHGRNGLLVNFFSPTELADTVSMALGERRGFAQLCSRARETVLEDYSVATCLPRQLSIIAEMTGRRTHQPESCLPVTRRPVRRA
jgi:glycosyltransferase involved in cell wall biosynthesis